MTCPVPPHALHTPGFVPDLMPVPEHRLHTVARRILNSRSAPMTACSNSRSRTASTSLPLNLLFFEDLLPPKKSLKTPSIRSSKTDDPKMSS